MGHFIVSSLPLKIRRTTFYKGHDAFHSVGTLEHTVANGQDNADGRLLSPW